MTSRPDARPIVVGVDPGPTSRPALAWAADEADRRELPLRLVHVRETPPAKYRTPDLEPAWETWDEALRTLGTDALDEAEAFVRDRRPRVDVSVRLAAGDAASVLSAQAREAAAVVLGSRHLTAVEELVRSLSVAVPVIARADCPVIVVREAEHALRQHPYVVVGVDGSPDSAAAVDYAFEEAVLRGAGLRALYVWHPPLLGVMDEHAALQECRRLLSEIVAGRTAAHPDVRVHHEVVRGHPVKVLSETSADALGLVVGARGLGGFAGLLLGSVSQGVLHHALSPVMVVPSAERRIP
ncbi:universal stress protein UspA [Streptomyces bungoensis]|uniref:Universal stress protein UspA n=1 Tax=Streptomyces bungoensis TaxID=285568 RepID=A0A101SUN3_9ACTN|nr:universal stress protein [Streptomyces bungoensis]KUN80525.1 universal stress protein UspA [Streptomyces bungoensis]